MTVHSTELQLFKCHIATTLHIIIYHIYEQMLQSCDNRSAFSLLLQYYYNSHAIVQSFAVPP